MRAKSQTPMPGSNWLRFFKQDPQAELMWQKVAQRLKNGSDNGRNGSRGHGVIEEFRQIAKNCDLKLFSSKSFSLAKATQSRRTFKKS